MPTSAVVLERGLVDTDVEGVQAVGRDVAELDVTRLVRRAANGDPRAW